MGMSVSGPHGGGAAPAVRKPVTLHIYNVGRSAAVPQLNNVFRALGGGVFHCGVVVSGIEWSYGYAPDGQTGVFWCLPRRCEGHTYRESVPMGNTAMPSAEITALIMRMKKEWPGSAYDPLAHNCCHFTDEVCRRLGVGDIPDWIKSLAATGASVAATGTLAGFLAADVLGALLSIGTCGCAPCGGRCRRCSEKGGAPGTVAAAADGEDEIVLDMDRDIHAVTMLHTADLPDEGGSTPRGFLILV
mmetsp:Transcript_59003/g.166358  ORF Transcript_59003/g.166358 Transcript_59003/m.166358 type:complete len:245 (+) Transcript_59003:75-809(+)